MLCRGRVVAWNPVWTRGLGVHAIGLPEKGLASAKHDEQGRGTQKPVSQRRIAARICSVAVSLSKNKLLDRSPLLAAKAAFWLVSVFRALPKGMPASCFGVSSARVYTSRIPSVPAVSFLLPKDLNILLMQRLFCSMLGWT